MPVSLVKTVRIQNNGSNFGNAAVAIPYSCDACGDDLDIHDWIDVSADGSTIVNCDRL